MAKPPSRILCGLCPAMETDRYLLQFATEKLRLLENVLFGLLLACSSGKSVII